MSLDRGRPTLYLMVGLPGAGKTTRARELERERRALRLTPDEWMLPLFGASDVDGARDVLEGRFVWLAHRALATGTNVVLDFGPWGRDERSALRALAARRVRPASWSGCRWTSRPSGSVCSRGSTASRRRRS